jgi:hypothetical protein
MTRQIGGAARDRGLNYSLCIVRYQSFYILYSRSCGKWRRVPAQASEAPFSWISDAAASSDATRRAAEPLSGHTRNRLQSLAVADQKPNSSNSDAIQWFHFTCRYNPDATHADCSVPEESLTATEQIAKHQGATR